MAATPAITAPAIMPIDAPDVCRHSAKPSQHASCIVQALAGIQYHISSVQRDLFLPLLSVDSLSLSVLFLRHSAGWGKADQFGTLVSSHGGAVTEVQEVAHTFLEALLCARAAIAACALKLVRVRWQTALILWYPSAQAPQAAPS